MPGTRDNTATSPQVIDVVIETPRESRCKYYLDEQTKEVRLKFVLPAGAIFPYDFGFVPRTLAEDGDPLDVLVFLDAPTVVGCTVSTRLLGVIEAEQNDGREVIRNDRLLAVATESHEYGEWRTLKHVGDRLLSEIEHFFVSYNQMRGKQFRVLARRGPPTAWKLVNRSQKAAQRRVARKDET